MANITRDLTLSMPSEVDSMLKKMCRENHLTFDDFMLKSMALMALVLQHYKKKANRIAFLDTNGHIMQGGLQIQELVDYERS